MSTSSSQPRLTGICRILSSSIWFGFFLIHPSIQKSNHHPSIHHHPTTIHPPIHPSIRSSINPSSIHPSTHLPNNPIIHRTIHPSMHPGSAGSYQSDLMELNLEPSLCKKISKIYLPAFIHVCPHKKHSCEINSALHMRRKREEKPYLSKDVFTPGSNCRKS